MAVRQVFPLGAVAVLHALCALLVGLYAAMAAVEDGLVRLAAIGITAAALLLWVAATRVTLLRRSDDDAPQGDHLDLRAPTGVVVCLLGAWGLMLLSVMLWGVLLLTGARAVESPGFMLVAVLGAAGSLPDLLRLATGRLHRWSLRTDEAGLHYAGWRSRVDVGWSDVVRIDAQDRPAGVVVHRRNDEPLTLTVTPFDVTPAGLAQRLQGARARARH